MVLERHEPEQDVDPRFVHGSAMIPIDDPRDIGTAPRVVESGTF
jgi:hypothetical protein